MESANIADQFPSFPTEMPQTKGPVLVAAGALASSFKQATKGRRAKPIFSYVAVAPGDGVTTLATIATGDSGPCISTCPAPDCKFQYKDVQDVLPTGMPLFRIAVNPDRLATLADMAKGFTAKYDIPVVVLEFWAQNKPMLLRSQNYNDKFTGGIMPININNDEEYIQQERLMKVARNAVGLLEQLHNYASNNPGLPSNLQFICSRARDILEDAGCLQSPVSR
jgi:hypothetical protein